MKTIFEKSGLQFRRFALLGMSGLGKTHISRNLVRRKNWSHYSVDYEIGKLLFKGKYENLLEGFEVDNITNLSNFLGKPGAISMGGISFSEYTRRQHLHRSAEITATLKVCSLVENSPNLSHLICDTSGSLCELVNPLDKKDKILTSLSKNFLIICLEAPDSIYETLIKRFIAKPKPMYYEEAFLNETWLKFKKDTSKAENKIDPDDFTIYGFKALIKRRKQIYNIIAKNWGISLNTDDLRQIKSGDDLIEAIKLQIDRRIETHPCQ
jgi:hypothetical protein